MDQVWPRDKFCSACPVFQNWNVSFKTLIWAFPEKQEDLAIVGLHPRVVRAGVEAAILPPRSAASRGLGAPFPYIFQGRRDFI